MRSRFRVLRACAAAWFFAAATTAFAADASVSDELLVAQFAQAYAAAVQPGEQMELHRDLFATVLARVRRSYAREVVASDLVATAVKAIDTRNQSGDPAEVFKKAINAALASLDPHSRYLDPRAHSDYRTGITGQFGGLGLQVEMAEGGLIRIVAPMPDTPAARAGLQTGDLIVRFDDQPVHGIALADAVSRMRGAPGTPITLTIRRAGREDEFTVALVRETIRTASLRWSMEGDVLVLRLSSFTTGVAGQIQKAIADATAARTPRAVILDMRGNGGGLFREAVHVADTFLSRGEIVSVSTRAAGTRRSWQADPAELLTGTPMIVLLDGRSASASELVAAALQENGRAIVIGQRSFGKGSVQTIVALGQDKGALRLTTSLYHGPSGRTVQRTGVGPDIELLTTATAAARREADRERALPGADEPGPPKAQVLQSRCVSKRRMTDAPLACALAFIDAGGVEPFLAALEPTEAALR